VVFGRTESFPGEFANVHVEVEFQGDGSQSATELFEEASRLVKNRLREERRRRLDPWGDDQQSSLDSFAETLEGGQCP
jgi:hypothetical protein